MRLVKQSGDEWQYHLHPNEADILRGLLHKFPFTAPDPAEISRSDTDAGAAEREQLLHESLAEHREKLQQVARDLLTGERWEKIETGQALTLDAESREVLLQILNDIRVGCWRALGQPSNLDVPTRQSGKAQGYRVLMDMADYFEMGLIEPEAE